MREDSNTFWSFKLDPTLTLTLSLAPSWNIHFVVCPTTFSMWLPTNKGKLETLNSEFKVHHYAVVDVIDEEAALLKEQGILDKHDDDTFILTIICLQKLITACSHLSKPDSREVQFQRLQHWEKGLSSIVAKKLKLCQGNWGPKHCPSIQGASAWLEDRTQKHLWLSSTTWKRLLFDYPLEVVISSTPLAPMAEKRNSQSWMLMETFTMESPFRNSSVCLFITE